MSAQVFWDAVDVPGVVVDDVEGAGGVEDAAGVSEALLAFLGCIHCPEHPALALALLFACLKAWHLCVQCPGCSQK
jgi:hypothetical protein